MDKVRINDGKGNFKSLSDVIDIVFEVIEERQVEAQAKSETQRLKAVYQPQLKCSDGEWESEYSMLPEEYLLWSVNPKEYERVFG